MIEVVSRLPRVGEMSSWSVRSTTVQALGSPSEIIWDAVPEWDTLGEFDTVGKIRVTVEDDGLYLIGATILYQPTIVWGPLEIGDVQILVNDVQVDRNMWRGIHTAANGGPHPGICTALQLSSGDTVHVETFQNSGAAQNLDVTSASDNHFFGHRLE